MFCENNSTRLLAVAGNNAWPFTDLTSFAFPSSVVEEGAGVAGEGRARRRGGAAVLTGDTFITASHDGDAWGPFTRQLARYIYVNHYDGGAQQRRRLRRFSLCSQVESFIGDGWGGDGTDGAGLRTITPTTAGLIIVAGSPKEIAEVGEMLLSWTAVAKMASAPPGIVLVAFCPDGDCDAVDPLLSSLVANCGASSSACCFTLFSASNSPQGQHDAAQSIFNSLPISLYDASIGVGERRRYPQTRLSYPLHPNTGVFTSISKASSSSSPPPASAYDIGALAATIDALLEEAISTTRSTPSGVVMVIKDNAVLLEKAYGHHTYPNPSPDDGDDDGRCSSRGDAIPTTVASVYDLASLTKIVATTPSIMALYEGRTVGGGGVDAPVAKIDLDGPLGDYFPLARRVGSNKAGTPLRRILLHEAGFIPYIKFYESCAYGRELSSAPSLPASSPSPSPEQSQHQQPSAQEDDAIVYDTEVAANCWVRRGYYADTMLPTMLHSPLVEGTAGTYVYSDLSMYFMKEIVEGMMGGEGGGGDGEDADEDAAADAATAPRRSSKRVPFDEFTARSFFEPLGMYSTGYTPLKRLVGQAANAAAATSMDGGCDDHDTHHRHAHLKQSVLDRIVPTEEGDFRRSLIQGFTHDEGCALAGGVAGHAGLFGTANDLAIYCQLMLNKGRYGGRRYFEESTIGLFTTCQSTTSRRGLGFDRYDPDRSTGYPSPLANSSVYGHTGFTGTCVFIDPHNNFAFIFLANRVHPDRADRFLTHKYRARILDAIYNCFGVFEEQKL